MDVSRIPDLDEITSFHDNGTADWARGVTHSQAHCPLHNKVVNRVAFPLARACWLVGAPQIRNRGTVAGNLITASPANDTITPLWAMDATVTLASKAGANAPCPSTSSSSACAAPPCGPMRCCAHQRAPALKPTERGTFLKLGFRQAQAISVVNVAVVVDFAVGRQIAWLSAARDRARLRSPRPSCARPRPKPTWPAKS